MKLIDRLSGQSARRPPDRTHFGRWLFDSSDSTGETNGGRGRSGEILVPEGSGNWALLQPGDTSATRRGFFGNAIPDDQDAEAILRLGEMLQNPDTIDGDWLEWSELSPMAPGIDDTVKPHPLEKSIQAEIAHLAAVCRNPRTHIRRQTERIMVSRARRVARNAPEWLVSHTEDWEQRTITGVRPRRILAEIREERWDLYENRVAVRLVDDLVAWLRRRIFEVGRIRDDIYVRMEKIRVPAAGSHHRANRIYRLWGEAWNDDSAKIAEVTLNRLEELLYRLLGLMDSPLYKRVSPYVRAPIGFRTTNLFAHDDHYRGVTRLWHEWFRRGVKRGLSPTEVHARYQNLHKGFEAWCMLVIVRACSQLLLDPAEEKYLNQEIRPGCAISLNLGFRIEWSPIGRITFFADNDKNCPLLHFVPLLHGLEGARNRESLEARVAPLVEAVTRSDAWTIILHPARPGAPPFDKIAGIGNPPVPGVVGAIDFIRVSPFALDSVERVARAIRWIQLVPRWLAYPPKIKRLPESAMKADRGFRDVLEQSGRDGPWLERRDSIEPGWAVIREPPESCLATLAKHKRNAQTVLAQLEEQWNEAKKKRSAPIKKRRGRGEAKGTQTLNEGQLREQLRTAKLRNQAWERFELEVNTAQDKIGELLACPLCNGTTREFNARANDCFVARCSYRGCHAQWELRHDATNTLETGSKKQPDCGLNDRTPVLFRRSGYSGGKNWPNEGAKQHVDEVLGCDVLALPLSGGGFLPPRREPRSQ